MPRIYKGSETILKLLIDVPNIGTIDKIKIALFTDDRNNAQEFYSDSITMNGNIAYLTAPEWTFIDMNDGIINYIAQGESDNKPFIFERQSNYILKSSDGFEQSELMNGYYTKNEMDVKLEAEQDRLISGKTIKTINHETILGSGNIEIKTDLSGYATETWVKNQDYATNSDVDEFVGDRVGQVEQKFYDYYTKEDINNMGFAHSNELAAKQDELISGENIKTINGETILGQGDIQISGGSSDSECIVIEYVGDYIVTNYDTGEETHYDYVGSDRQRHNLEAIQKILKGDTCAIYFKCLLEQVERFDEELGYNCNPPTWWIVPLSYRYPSHDGIARFMSIAQQSEYGAPSDIKTIGLCLNEADASVYEFNINYAPAKDGDTFYSWEYYTKQEIDDTIGDINNILTSI